MQRLPVADGSGSSRHKHASCADLRLQKLEKEDLDHELSKRIYL